MKEFYRKMSWWKGLGDFFLILVVLGLITGWIQNQFYSIAIVGLIIDLFITLAFIIKSIMKAS